MTDCESEAAFKGRAEIFFGIFRFGLGKATWLWRARGRIEGLKPFTGKWVCFMQLKGIEFESFFWLRLLLLIPHTPSTSLVLFFDFSSRVYLCSVCTTRGSYKKVFFSAMLYLYFVLSFPQLPHTVV
ncbi:hypothetical protein IWX92DRAFT_233172 [Phyllosticta citricarpa]